MQNIDGKNVCESLAEVVDPCRAALVVVDIENSSMWDSGPDNVILKKAKSLTDSARAAGVPIFFFYNQRGPGLRHISAAYIRVLMNLGHDTEEKLHEMCGSKDDEVAVNSHLDPQPEDFVLPKRRGDAFQDAGFELLLRTLQRETLVLVGCSTDWCLEATAWAATNKDYYVVVAEDCTRSPRPDGHEAALIQFRAIGLDVVNSQELTELWQHL